MEKKKNLALERINIELERNEKILSNWNVRHEAIEQRLDNMLENPGDTLWSAFSEKKYFEIGLMTGGEALIDEILTNTAWEAAKSTEIIAEFDYELVEKLTQVYVMQEVLMDKTVSKILDLYFDSETHDLKKLDRVLLQFQLLFQELVGQERLLEYLYQTAIEEMEKKQK